MFEMTSKFPGRCNQCGAPFPAGTRIVYDKAIRKAFCLTCTAGGAQPQAQTQPKAATPARASTLDFSIPAGALPVHDAPERTITLDADQEAVCAHRLGECVVAAAAGSGKSTVLVERTADLLREGSLPEAILILTFNRLAAISMRDKLVKRLGEPAAKRVRVGTYHAFCYALLRSWGRYEGFAIVGTEDGPRKGTLFGRALRNEGIEGEADVYAEIDERIRESGIDVDARDAVDLVKDSRWGGSYAVADRIVRVSRAYAEIKREKRALDFTDMLVEVYRAVKADRPEMRKAACYAHVMVDEGQDTNHCQQAVALYLGQHAKSLLWVGDLRQCIPAGQTVRMADGTHKPIESIKVGDEVLGARGGRLVARRVLKRSQTSKTKAFEFAVRLPGGDMTTFRTTPEHVCFASIDDPGGSYLYLMYRPDMGFRVGVSRTVKDNGKHVVVRTQQEQAERLWVLEWHEQYFQAARREAVLSLEFGIPTVPFKVRNNMFADADTTEEIFARFGKNGVKLLEIYGLDFDRPNYVAKTSARGRVAVNLLIGSKGGHQVSIESANVDCSSAAALGMRIGRRNTVRLRRDFSNLRKAEAFAAELAAQVGGYISRSLACTDSARRMREVRAANIHIGMMTPVALPDGSIGTGKIVDKKWVTASDCYDLEVEDLGTFVVGDVLVHNSLYGWRGAEPEMMLGRIESGARLLPIRTCRRSTEAIVELGNVIARGRSWHLGGDSAARPDADAGEKPTVRNGSAPDIADVIKADLADAFSDPRHYAVLARTNAVLVDAECSLVARGLPVRVLGSRGGVWETAMGRTIRCYLAAAGGGAPEDLARIANRPVRYCKAETCDAAVREAQRGRSLTDALRSQGTRGALRLAADLERLAGLEFPARVAAVGDLLINDAEERAAGLKVDVDEDKISTIKALVNAANELGSREAIEEQVEKLKHTPDEAPAVTLGTCHAAKGLEWRSVHVLAVDEGVLPHAKAEDIEEERRLLYVACTRASHKLTLWTTRPSPFLSELGDAVEHRAESGVVAPQVEQPTAPQVEQPTTILPSNLFEGHEEGIIEELHSGGPLATNAERKVDDPFAGPTPKDEELGPDESGGDRYVYVRLASMRALLEPAGFTGGIATMGNQYVFTCPSKVFDTVRITIYTSIPVGEDVAKELGEDSIRVVAVDTRRSKPVLPRQAWVARTKGWRQSLMARLEEVEAKLAALPRCRDCSGPTRKREGRNGTFDGCVAYPCERSGR